MSEQVEARLLDAGMALPRPSKSIGIYATAVRSGNLLFVSGHGPLKPDRALICGRLGDTLTILEGAEAARVTAMNMLSTVKVALGSLERVVRVVKVLGLVRAVPDFTEQPQVIDGFSNVMRIAFGEPAGMSARSAIGVASLPDGICVEVEAIFEIRD